jgi:hypothetical protein
MEWREISAGSVKGFSCANLRNFRQFYLTLSGPGDLLRTALKIHRRDACATFLAQLPAISIVAFNRMWHSRLGCDWLRSNHVFIHYG